MLLQKKFVKILCTVLLGSQFIFGAAEPEEKSLVGAGSFKLGRVHVPTVAEVALQKNLQENRVFRRYAVTAGVSVAVVIGLYGLACMSHAVEEAKQRGTIWVPAGTVVAQRPVEQQQTSSGVLWPIVVVVNGIKSFGISVTEFSGKFAKFFADSSMMMAAGVASNAVYQYMSAKVSQSYQEETLKWFVDQQTKIKVIFEDLKQRTSEYDLHGALLSQEMLSLDTQMHLKAFVHEISDAAADYKHDNIMRDYDYFAYLLGEVKKKYIRQADHLEQMQNQIAPLIAQRHRALAQLENTSLFDRDAQARADIADLAAHLVFEMNALIAFIEMHHHRHQGRVKDLIVSCNRFLDHVETMLNCSPEQVAAMSKENRGIFTVTYEYQRLFDQQITFLDTYCTIVRA